MKKLIVIATLAFSANFAFADFAVISNISCVQKNKLIVVYVSSYDGSLTSASAEISIYEIKNGSLLTPKSGNGTTNVLVQESRALVEFHSADTNDKTQLKFQVGSDVQSYLELTVNGQSYSFDQKKECDVVTL